MTLLGRETSEAILVNADVVLCEDKRLRRSWKANQTMSQISTEKEYLAVPYEMEEGMVEDVQ